MYAVIKTGGKQYRVAEGETLRVEKLEGGKGSKVTFGPLLFADDGGGVQVGQPTVKGVTVEAEGVFILPKWARATIEQGQPPSRFE